MTTRQVAIRLSPSVRESQVTCVLEAVAVVVVAVPSVFASTGAGSL
ncbi:MAG: hypothetical protein P1P90_00555 [Patescibacteria group bacterium]|nr:hypothetical protein [Patescibacteria group bacterium]